MKKTIIVNGEYFEICKATEIRPSNLSFRGLSSCYKHYSSRKQSIFNEWQNFFIKLGTNTWFEGVNSYNAMQFTLSAYCHEAIINEIKVRSFSCRFYITKSHNTIIVPCDVYDILKKDKNKTFTLLTNLA